MHSDPVSLLHSHCMRLCTFKLGTSHLQNRHSAFTPKTVETRKRQVPSTHVDHWSKIKEATGYILNNVKIFLFFLIQARRDFCDAGLILQIRKPSPGVGSRLFLAKVSQHQIFHLPLPQADLPASMLSSFISDRPSVCGAEQVSSMLERGKVIHQQSLSYRYHTHQSLP